MTDGTIGGMVEHLRRRLFTLNGTIALVGILALIIGFRVGSAALLVLCFLIAAAAGAYLYASWRSHRPLEGDEPRGQQSQTAEAQVKTLVFDDFQSAGSGYVVRETEEEAIVVPSSKSTRPASVSLKPETVRELEILDFFDLDSDEPYAAGEPKNEFHSLLDKVLLVLKDVLFARTVVFFWVNGEKHQLVLESVATDSEHFIENKRYPVEHDLASQVAETGKPQCVGHLGAHTEQELLRYYESPDGIQSALGVPVFFRDNTKNILPVGVIVADSRAEDAFGQETIVLLGRFTKLISALVKNYTDKYDLLLDSELLSSLRKMQDKVKSDPSERTILAALVDEANRLTSWDFLTITMYSEGKRGWVVQKVVNKPGEPYVAPEQPVEMSASLVGEVIRTNVVKVVEALDEHACPRFTANEPRAAGGSFLCVPLSSYNRCYGALTLESKSKREFSGTEVEAIYRLVEHAGGALEVSYMNDVVKEHVMIDHVTGSLTKKYYAKSIEEEVRRADDFGTELSSALIVVDGMQEHIARYGKEGAEAIMLEVAGIIRGSLRTYDVLGRQEDDRFGVLLVSTAATDGYLWAERIRKLVASHVMTVEGKSFSVTISGGVCGLSEGTTPVELMAGTQQVLEKALEKGGNLVRVY